MRNKKHCRARQVENAHALMQARREDRDKLVAQILALVADLAKNPSQEKAEKIKDLTTGLALVSLKVVECDKVLRSIGIYDV